MNIGIIEITKAQEREYQEFIKGYKSSAFYPLMQMAIELGGFGDEFPELGKMKVKDIAMIYFGMYEVVKTPIELVQERMDDLIKRMDGCDIGSINYIRFNEEYGVIKWTLDTLGVDY